ncbi:MAG: hypothetical protein IKK94_06815 [Clostridia bacterium]|nr:hypothetical protein [Clostridia bacterium]
MRKNIGIKIDTADFLPKRKNIKKSKKIAFCALFSALSVVLLYVGAIIEVMDISMACIASMLCIVALTEIGGAYPWLVYGVTGAISLLILPQKFGAIIYIGLAGYYPMVKFLIESHQNRLIGWILKILLFNVSMGIIVWASLFLVTTANMTKAYIISLFALGNFTFVIYDIALSLLVKLYFLKYRKLLRIDKILK